jgi:hypothetical protein
MASCHHRAGYICQDPGLLSGVLQLVFTSPWIPSTTPVAIRIAACRLLQLLAKGYPKRVDEVRMGALHLGRRPMLHGLRICDLGDSLLNTSVAAALTLCECLQAVQGTLPHHNLFAAVLAELARSLTVWAPREPIGYDQVRLRWGP